MTTIQFSDDELDLLQSILENNLTTLGVEVHRTDNTEFKHKLNDRYKMLEKMVERVNETRTALA